MNVSDNQSAVNWVDQIWFNIFSFLLDFQSEENSFENEGYEIM